MAGLAQVAGTRKPDRIAVVWGTNAYVREATTLVGLVPGQRTLAIGAPLLEGLTVTQLRSVLGHELGHLASGDTRLGPLAWRTDLALGHLVHALHGRAVSIVFEVYWNLQSKVSSKVRRRQELVADQTAVRVGGRPAAADALATVGFLAAAEDLYVTGYLVPLLRAGARPADLMLGLRALASDPTRRDRLVAEAARERPSGPHDTHPATPARIRQVATLEDVAVASDDARPAAALLRDPKRLIDAAGERWLRELLVDAKSLRVVEWDDFGAIVLDPPSASMAADVDKALARLSFPAGPEGVAAAMAGGKGPDLAAALVASGWSSGGHDERNRVLRAAARYAVERAAMAEGARWTFSWSVEAGMVDRAGSPVDLSGLTARVLDGT